VPDDTAKDFLNEVKSENAVRIPTSFTKSCASKRRAAFGVDADETTIVPELGIEI
jgi:hypothetical protein